MTSIARILLLPLLLFAAACSSTTRLPPIPDGVNRIQVSARVGCDQPRLGTGHGCSTIEDPARIRAITAAVNDFPKGWSMPWYGAPILPIRVEFYRDEELIESVGLGEFTLERQMFLSRRIPDGEAARLLELIGLTQTQLLYRPDDQTPD